MNQGYKYCNDKTNLTKKYNTDAGLDIKANDNFIVPARGSKVITTGLFIAIPHNHVGLIWSRSGLSVKNKIEVGAGCVDESYRGEILVHLYNHGDEDFEIWTGQKIAQLLTIPINLCCYEQVDDFGWSELSNTERGINGFGSTGQ